jgi:hypothetical protein
MKIINAFSKEMNSLKVELSRLIVQGMQSRFQQADPRFDFRVDC